MATKTRKTAPQPIVVAIDDGYRMVGLGRSTGYKVREIDPTFPRPIEISPGRKGFIVAELEGWVRSRAAARDDEEGGIEIPGDYRVA